MAVLAISYPMLRLYWRMVLDIVVSGKAIDVMHHCLFLMYILIILGIGCLHHLWICWLWWWLQWCMPVGHGYVLHDWCLAGWLFGCYAASFTFMPVVCMRLTVYALIGWSVTLLSCEFQMLYMWICACYLCMADNMLQWFGWCHGSVDMSGCYWCHD